MKKTMVYVFTAILLGFAIMILPLTLETKPPSIEPLQPQTLIDRAKTNFAMERLEGSVTSQYGLGSQPLNLLPSSLIFFSGLIVALGVYAILRRRII